MMILLLVIGYIMIKQGILGFSSKHGNNKEYYYNPYIESFLLTIIDITILGTSYSVYIKQLIRKKFIMFRMKTINLEW